MTLPILVKDGKYYSSLEPLPPVPICEVYKWDELSKIDQSECRESVNCPCHIYQQALSKWRIEVEDQNRVNELLPEFGIRIGKDGLYFIEVKEAEMVVQVNKDFGATNTWEDVDGPNDYPASCHRVVFRITK